jgi:hypothetical protein
MSVSDIPTAYMELYKKPLDYSFCSDIMVWLQQLESRCVVSDSSQVPESLRDALQMAGFTLPISADTGEVMGCRDPGFRRARGVTLVAVSRQFSKYVHELKTFRESIVEVITHFAKSCHIPNTGLSLSLFSSEWDKFFISKGLTGMPDLKTLRDRFGVVKLMSFLQGIPGLEVTGTHPEIRVKAKPIVLGGAAPTPLSTRSLTLHEELFGGKQTSQKPVQPREFISQSLVRELASQVDRQVLELSSHLAARAMQLSSQDLIQIRLRLQQLQALKTSLDGIASTVTVEPLPRKNADKYTAMLSQAAQYAMSAAAGKPPAQSAASTAANSCKASPTSSVARPLSELEVKSLIVKVVERSTATGGSIGIPLSKLSSEWALMFPSLPPLDTLMNNLKLPKMKDLIAQIPSLVLFYSSVPALQHRVATRTEYLKHFGTDTSSRRPPLISPGSECCSYTSEVEEEISKPDTRTTNNRDLLELVLGEIRKTQTDAMMNRNKPLMEIFNLVNSTKSTSARLLDSRRPPPIDTGSGVKQPVSPLIKEFTAAVTDLILTKQMFAMDIDVDHIVEIWNKRGDTRITPERLQDVPELAIVERPPKRFVSVTALCTPGAIVSSLFLTFDPIVWSKANTRLMKMVDRFVRSSHTLTELSALLFKSIMAGGPQSAKECAEALRTLAERDPKAIHAIVSEHVHGGASAASATAFVQSLMNKGKMVKESATTSQPTFSRVELLRIRKELGDSLSQPPSSINDLHLVSIF